MAYINCSAKRNRAATIEIKELHEENQKLWDENNRLKGEQGKPNIKSNKQKGFQSNHSSEKERHTPKNILQVAKIGV
ncbi:MAG: hypothetical protein V7L05_22065 [Nostoc sp.]|uniref:hypothetical protein n=1 Tax=Nostoc sp. TaxID=1180 RepID=UPI002FFAAF2B